MMAAGRWDFFISHRQAEAGQHALQLVLEFGKRRCWLDKYAADRSVRGMRAGVEGSAHFVALLSETYFDSEYCVKEMRWAVELGKPIVLCCTHGCNVGAVLRGAPSDLKHVAEIQAIKVRLPRVQRSSAEPS